MKIAFCDDQSAHIELLQPYVNEFFLMKEIETEYFEFFDGNEIINSKEKFDIVFLDMELGNMTGITVAKEIKSKNPNSVIIVVTSYSEYLDEAMDLHVIRFLKKPVVQSKVYSALEKALQEINDKLIVFTTKTNRIIRLRKDAVIYIESGFRYVNVCTINGTYSVKDPLKKLKESLSSDVFAVPHNSFIVNMNYISKFSREVITIDALGREVNIMVSNRKQPEFKRRFLAFVGEGE